MSLGELFVIILLAFSILKPSDIKEILKIRDKILDMINNFKEDLYLTTKEISLNKNENE
jgi:hypothetical protein